MENFVNFVQESGAGFIIWSLTWWESRMQMPVDAVDEIMGNQDYTTERNLVGEIAAEDVYKRQA